MRRGLQVGVILLVAAYMGGLYIAISSAGAAIWPRRPAAASGAFSCSGSDLACWDFSGTDTGATTGNCDGETGNPSDTIDFACTDGDCECDAVTDGSEVFDYTSDGTSCGTPDAANSFGWDQAWTAETDDVTALSFCVKIVAEDSLADTEMVAVRSGTGNLEDTGFNSIKVRRNQSGDTFGVRCGNSTQFDATTVTEGVWAGVVVELDATASSEGATIWVNDSDTTTGGTACTSGLGWTGDPDGLVFTMCESDTSTFRYRFDNMRVHATTPTDGSVTGLKCGDS